MIDYKDVLLGYLSEVSLRISLAEQDLDMLRRYVHQIEEFIKRDGKDKVLTQEEQARKDEYDHLDKLLSNPYEIENKSSTEVFGNGINNA